MKPDDRAGWFSPDNATKWHFFFKGRSLCGVWLYTGQTVARSKGNSTANLGKACLKKATDGKHE